MLMGPQSTRARARRVPRAHPRRAAQLHRPARASSSRPARRGIRAQRVLAPRRVDLRPYILTSARRPVGAAGRAHARGAPRGIVRRNSSQGGGSQGHLGASERGDSLISRVADHCFWFGRYLERAESTARVLAVTAQPRARRRAARRAVLAPVIDRRRRAASTSSSAARRRRRAGDGETVQRYMTWDEDNLASVARARWRARARTRAPSARCFSSRRGRRSTSSTCGCERRARATRVRRAPRRLLPPRAPPAQLVPGPPAQHDAARRRRSTSSGSA